jgi:hydrogenase/urease accessory protein HupE
MRHALARGMVLLWLLAADGMAHEARPVALRIEERDVAVYAVDLRVPASVEVFNRPELSWPQDCSPDGALLRCQRSLSGRSVALRWPLYNPAVSVLVRFTPRAEAERSVVLPPGVSQWTLPAQPSSGVVLRSYFVLGVSHILGGADHLLFVGGLLLLARGARRLVLAISGFTLAHSVTLSLAALGIVRVPIAPTEAAIALSILFLAREASLPDEQSLTRRFPLLVSAAFGLLHGLGFAAALGETGLPTRKIVWALLSFNLGVEAGQLTFIAALLGGIALLGKALQGRTAWAAWTAHARVMGAYAIGVPAAFWLLQRLPLQRLL